MIISIKCFNKNMLQENTFVVYDEASEEVAVIDPGCYPAEMKSLLEEYGKVNYIILTHGHSDHIASVNDIKKDYPDAVIIANKDEKKLLNSPTINGSLNLFLKPIDVEADKYVSDGDSVKLGEVEFTFITTPGHSPGGMCIHTSDGVLFSGDTLFKASIGRTDLYEGDFDTLISSIADKLYELPGDTIVLPGHGPATTISYEKRVNPFVCIDSTLTE